MKEYHCKVALWLNGSLQSKGCEFDFFWGCYQVITTSMGHCSRCVELTNLLLLVSVSVWMGNCLRFESSFLAE